jgi:hypothetical protein
MDRVASYEAKASPIDGAGRYDRTPSSSGCLISLMVTSCSSHSKVAPWDRGAPSAGRDAGHRGRNANRDFLILR